MHTVRSQQHDTIALICWRNYGSTQGGLVEKVINANPECTTDGPILPIGTTVVLPDLITTTPTQPLTQLWD